MSRKTKDSTAGPRAERVPFTVAVLAPSFPPAFKSGGPARTLDALTRSTPPSHTAFVFAPDTDIDRGERLSVTSNAWSGRGSVQTFYASVESVASLFAMYREVRRLRPDAVYLNSFFNPKFSIIPRLLVALRWWRPDVTLIAPRGEFNPAALAIRARKKKTFLRVYRLLRLQRGLVWHASSSIEEAAIRGMWKGQTHVVTREDETELPEEPLAPSLGGDVVNAVFLGRISRMKGLDILLMALRQVKSDLVLNVYGPPEDPTYLAECRRLAGMVPSHVLVQFLGPIAHSQTREALAQGDIMLMPTRGENFGHVIAEALSASCPVMIPDTTPWTSVLRQGGGYVIDPNTPSQWAEAIDAFASQSVEQRYERRRAAGSAYRDWRRSATAPHVFQQMLLITGHSRLEDHCARISGAS